MFPCACAFETSNRDLSVYNNKLFTIQQNIYVQRHTGIFIDLLFQKISNKYMYMNIRKSYN